MKVDISSEKRKTQTDTKLTTLKSMINYRLRKAIELLKTTDKTVLEISLVVGFSGASYFAETFRKSTYAYYDIPLPVADKEIKPFCKLLEKRVMLYD